MVLRAIKYTRGHLSILDQLQLPHAEHYDDIHNTLDGWHAIKAMRVRGAPAIAIVAALSLAVELHVLHQSEKLSSVAEEVGVFILEKLDYLVTSRPTAVNLADAARKLKIVVEQRGKEEKATGAKMAETYIVAAERMLVDDVKDNQNIGDFGARWILERAGEKEVAILTHCNTGSLATAGYGTALGVIRSLHASSSLQRAYCTETRPYNQGSRLTAYELVHDKIPATMVTDSMAAALLAKPGSKIAAIVVGADRVAANGDTANKIGTYSLAVLAKYHGVKFLVAAPRTTIDRNTKSGDDIIIEERAKSEVTSIRGPVVKGESIDVSKVESVSIAAQGIDVWNPAFDITPASLIDGVITEVGVVGPSPNGTFNFEGIFAQSLRNDV